MSSTSSLSMALLIIMCIDAFFLIGNTAMINLNPDSNTNIFNYQNSTLSSFDTNADYVLNKDYISNLPSGSSSVSPETDTEFTDTFKSIKSWFQDTTIGKGFTYGFKILGAPIGFLQIINAPQVITFSLGAIWYGLTFFLLVMLMFGRN